MIDGLVNAFPLLQGAFDGKDLPDLNVAPNGDALQAPEIGGLLEGLHEAGEIDAEIHVDFPSELLARNFHKEGLPLDFAYGVCEDHSPFCLIGNWVTLLASLRSNSRRA